jgi:sugar phosphate isomerase/epimerase
MIKSVLPTIDRLAINQITTRTWSLTDAVKGYARHNIRSIAVWRDKLAETGIREAVKLVDNHGMRVVELTSVRIPVEPAATWSCDDVMRAFDEAASINAETLLILASPPAAVPSSTMLSVLAERLNEVIGRAPSGLDLVIEPLHPVFAADVSPLNTLRDALDLCDQVERLGVVVDTYNLWWDWDLKAQIIRAGPRLKGFHVADWLPGSLGNIRYDRGMMGDGCIDTRLIRHWMSDAGYRGPIQVEIFSENRWWKEEPDLVVRTCIDRFFKHC